MSKILKILSWVVGILIGLILLGILIALFVYSPEYIRRVLVFRKSNYETYMTGFPHSRLHADQDTFYFAENLNEERVSKLFEGILEREDFDTFLEEMGTQAFIVIQDDEVIYEKYFNGAQRDSLLTSFSVAKPFTSALVGIAVEEGYINSIDDPITDYLPELEARDSRFKQITIRNILMMASGLEFQELRWGIFNGDDPLTTYFPDQRQAALEFTQTKDSPGQYFQYNKYHPQLLGLIIERATGLSVTDYTQEKLWNSLGMEFDGSWSLDSEESGFEKMEAGLNARAIDFAKFGRLYLNGGDWNGEQVIPEEWVRTSTQVDRATQKASYYPDNFGQTIFHDLNGYYKYMWYGYLRDEGFDFAAEGDHGQFIYVAPHKNLIIVRNGLEYGIPWDEWIKSFYRFASDL